MQTTVVAIRTLTITVPNPDWRKTATNLLTLPTLHILPAIVGGEGFTTYGTMFERAVTAIGIYALSFLAVLLIVALYEVPRHVRFELADTESAVGIQLKINEGESSG